MGRRRTKQPLDLCTLITSLPGVVAGHGLGPATPYLITERCAQRSPAAGETDGLSPGRGGWLAAFEVFPPLSRETALRNPLRHLP